MRSVTVLFLGLALAFAFVSAERILKFDSKARESDKNSSFLLRAASFLWESDQTGYHHVWPVSVIFLSTFEYITSATTLIRYILSIPRNLSLTGKLCWERSLASSVLRLAA